MKLILCVLMVFMMNVSATNVDSKSRQLIEYYHSAAKSKEGNIMFENHLETVKNEIEQKKYLAFKANVHFFNAQYFDNPFRKLSEFKKGKEILEQLIASEPNEILTRYFRFAVQINTPAILDYKQNIEEDRRFLASFAQTCETSEHYICKSVIAILESKK